MIVGASALAIRRPDAIAFGERSLVAKSCMASLRRKPQRGTTKPLPNVSPSVVVIAATLPSLSAIVKCVVCRLCAIVADGSVNVMVGVARVGLIDDRHCAARAGENSSRYRRRDVAGSPR